MEERLQKILARAGVASRRAAETMIAEGRITKNGETVREPGTKADLETDDVRVDGVRVRAPRDKTYLLLYKPRGVVTTRHDPERRTTVMDLVPRIAGLFPVGRLDVGTEGLILLTNDGEFAERVSHPRYEVPRVYEAKVHGIPDAETLARLLTGIRVEGQRLVADRVRVLEAEHNAWLELTLHEGKNHEVRRLLEAAGHPVSKLKRTALGPLTLKGLEPGQFRALTPREVKGLGTLPTAARRPKRSVALPESMPERPAFRRPAPSMSGADHRKPERSRSERPRTVSDGSARTENERTAARRPKPEWTGAERTRPKWAGTGRTKPTRAGAARTKPESTEGRTQRERTDSEGTRSEWAGSGRTRPQRTDATRTRPEWAGSGRTGTERAKTAESGAEQARTEWRGSGRTKPAARPRRPGRR